jgi:Flp pilus assembly protein TadG
MFFFAFLILGLLGVAALVVDLGQLYSVKTKLQGVADASALAAAAYLPTTSTALATATSYAALNYATSGSVVKSSDVVFGCWKSTFTAENGRK